jgi:hypothetical protein
MDRLFPSDASDGSSHRPWVTIALSVKTLSRHLALRNNNGRPVNVWFTGHSLGCAIASLGYARALTAPEDFGRMAKLRDAYLFAAPVVCDAASAHGAFSVSRYNDGAHGCIVVIQPSIMQWTKKRIVIGPCGELRTYVFLPDLRWGS